MKSKCIMCDSPVNGEELVCFVCQEKAELFEAGLDPTPL